MNLRRKTTMGEVYIKIEERIVKIDLENEKGYSDVDWEEEDEEMQKAKVNRLIKEYLE